VAEGIAIPHPPRLEQMLAAVRRSGGRFVTVTDDEILDARRRLAGRGIDVEPTAAAVWAAEPAATAGPGTVVVALTGAGLKSTS
jgi:threonine synthase